MLTLHPPRHRAVARALGATVAVVAALLVAPSASGAAEASSLAKGATLAPGASLRAASGAFTFAMQTDGNLVLYGSNGALWSTQTRSAGSRLVLQTDGNLVVYTPADQPVWASKTAGSAASQLVVQDDGDVALFDPSNRMLWHTKTTQTTSPVSIGSSVPVDVPLTPLRYLTSPSGGVTARFAADGSFTVSVPSQVLWTARAGAQTGQRFVLQRDGNVVMYGATIPLWTSQTTNSAPARLAVQDDGNFVAYASNGAPIWATMTSLPQTPAAGADRLLRGQQLLSGTQLTSPGGAYRLAQQADGNVVLYGPSGVSWTTNTAGWGSVRTVLQPDGNVVTYSAGGQALWTAGTADASSLVMQSDGNLVAYRSNGTAAWSSRYTPAPPQLFPPQKSPPTAAVSRYLRNLNGTSSDTSFMRTAGCSDAKAVPNGKRYLTFLAFGAQTPNVNGGWGVNLTASTGLITNGAVVSAVTAYIDGYRGCMGSYSALTIAVGTNNDGGSAALSSNGGAIWATQVINPIAAYAAAGGRVTIAAANDIEPGFAGTPAQAVSWMQGYLANSPAPFVNTGSADGCPQTLGSTTSCNLGWSPKVLYDLTFGMMSDRSLPLVQIYYTSMAKQWANISLIGAQATGTRMQFAGPLTEVTACQQAGSCYSMDANSAWNTLWNQLRSDSRTTVDDLQYTTDLRIDGR